MPERHCARTGKPMAPLGPELYGEVATVITGVDGAN